MKLLVLGGTKFLGRAVVDAALERGHEPTLFNRGQTNPDLYPGVERIRGDRDGQLSALEGRSWDAVVDPSGHVPRVVRASGELLASAVDHYVFVSSISVYRDFSRPRFDEDAALIELEDPSVEDVQEHYGGLKALCERTVADIFPARAAIVRAGLIVGPHDPTDRFTYWPVRVARGGEVLAPGPPERRIQFVDVRDLGDWLVRLAEHRTAGAYNATGPIPPVSFGELLAECRRVSGSDATITWVEEDFLLEHRVGQWMELPLWLAQSDLEWAHMQEADVSRAVAAGLRFRPLAETIRDTLAWHATRQDAAPTGTTALPNASVGMAAGREAALLAEWRARTNAAAR
ncbi:MAG: SDR family oxidoreductase [Thermoleophilia bacterium]|nr:SDR family oxidoreductase [Thermoleophilia bacterium]